MPTVTSASGASLQYVQALKLLQAGAGNGGASPADSSSSSSISPRTAKVDAAIQAILDLLLDVGDSRAASVQGYVRVEGHGENNTLVGDGSSVLVHGGGGDDRIVVRGRGLNEAMRGAYWPADASRPAAARWNTGGEGNDVMSIESHDRVHRTYGNGGDDIISIWSPYDSDAEDPGVLMRYAVRHTEGGDGDDTVLIAAGDVDSADGSFRPNGDVELTRGGSGDDTIEIWASNARKTYGNEGDDTIRITADGATNIKGGDGADTIEVTAARIGWVWGGNGDDTIVLNNTSGAMSSIGFHTGDGHDVVTTNAALGITRGGDRTLDMSKATFERVSDDTLIVSFEGAGDSITVHLTGEMVGKALAVDHYGGTALVIRRNDSEAPPIPQWGLIDYGVVLTPTSKDI